MAIQNQPGFIPAPFANSGTKNVIPETMPTPSASAAASWTDGFPTVCSLPLASGGIPPARADFNGLFNSITQAQAFYQSGGVYEWDATIDYGPNRLILGSDGKLYWSMAQSGPNTGAGAVDPTTDDGTCWGALPATTSGTATEADALATPRKIDGVAFDGTSDIVHFGECSTAGSTAEKTVSCPGFALQAGARIAVKFQNENLASSLLLNVESTGAKAVYAHGAAVSSGIFKAGCVYDFVYDGTQYQLLNLNNGDSVPAGTVLWLSTPTVPAGYLPCNGAAVGRATYPDLFAAIGTTYGSGNGSTTFNLPNLMGKVPWGSTSVGTVIAAGAPDIVGNAVVTDNVCVNTSDSKIFFDNAEGCFSVSGSGPRVRSTNVEVRTYNDNRTLTFRASKSNDIYGNSDTVQPPALCLLPCIRYE